MPPADMSRTLAGTGWNSTMETSRQVARRSQRNRSDCRRSTARGIPGAGWRRGDLGRTQRRAHEKPSNSTAQGGRLMSDDMDRNSRAKVGVGRGFRTDRTRKDQLQHSSFRNATQYSGGLSAEPAPIPPGARPGRNRFAAGLGAPFAFRRHSEPARRGEGTVPLFVSSGRPLPFNVRAGAARRFCRCRVRPNADAGPNRA